MLRSRLADWIVFAGIALVLASVGLMSSVLADWEQANGLHRLQQVTISVDQSKTSSASAGLGLKEAEKLAKQWSPLPVAPIARGQTKAVQGGTSTTSDVLGVDAKYREFTAGSMIAGTTIGQTSVDERSRVAVIGEKLADKLFHSVMVVGKTIELYGTAFRIIGVYDDSGSLLQQMSDDGIPDALIPVTTMFDVNSSARIDTVVLAAKPDAFIRGDSEATSLLKAVGLNPAQFRIANGSASYVRVAQLRSLLMFVCGSIAILMLLRLIIRQFTHAYALMKRRLSTLDWQDAVKNEKAALLKSAAAVIVMTACIAGLWELIRFRLYIPPDWVPEQIIDLSFYMEKLRSLWQKQVADAGYIPPLQVRLAAAAGQFAGRLFLAGGLFGFPLIFLGIRLWSMNRVSLAVQLQRLSLYIPATAVLAFAAALWAGSEYRIDLLEYAVCCVLFFIMIIHSNTDKGAKLSNAN